MPTAEAPKQGARQMPDVKQSLTVQERLNQGPAPFVGRLFTLAAINVHLMCI